MPSMLALLAAVALSALVACASAARADGAFLILSRRISGDLVQGVNFTVDYEVHNVGKSDATSLSLKDTAFPQSRFTAHSGAFRRTWTRLNAGERLKETVVAEPRRAGELLVNPASISYKDGGETRTTRLAGDESVVVEELLAYRRRTDTHGGAWAMYALTSAVSVGIPYFLSVRGVSKLGAPVRKDL